MDVPVRPWVGKLCKCLLGLAPGVAIPPGAAPATRHPCWLGWSVRSGWLQGLDPAVERWRRGGKEGAFRQSGGQLAIAATNLQVRG